MHGQALPVNVDVLRIMYSLTQQAVGRGSTLSAAAATEKLHTVDAGDNVLRTRLDYSSIQQSVAHAVAAVPARQRLRGAVKKKLRARIATAFGGVCNQAHGQ